MLICKGALLFMKSFILKRKKLIWTFAKIAYAS